MVLDRNPKIPLRLAERRQGVSAVAASRQIASLDGCVPCRGAGDLETCRACRLVLFLILFAQTCCGYAAFQALSLFCSTTVPTGLRVS